MTTHPWEFANVLLTFLNVDSTHIGIKSLSAVLLTHILRFKNQEELKNIRMSLSPEMRESMINIFKKNIFHENESVRNIVSECYALLCAILKEDWPSGIPEVVESAMNPKFRPYGTIGLISIMYEIARLPNFVAEIYPTYENQFSLLLVYCLENILQVPYTNIPHDDDVRLAACRYIFELIYHHKGCLGEEPNLKNSRIEFILKSLPPSFQIANLDLFQFLNRLLFIMVQTYYTESAGFMETIYHYVLNGINISNPEYRNISIYFWKEIGDLEFNIQKKYEMANQLKIQPSVVPVDPLISQLALESLFEPLISIMALIDENDTDVEDVSKNPEPSMFATVTLESFFKAVPERSFELFQPKIVEAFNNDKWTIRHAGLLLTYSLVEELPILRPQLMNDIGKFVASLWDSYIQCAHPSNPNYRLRETALFDIGLLLKNYPGVITKVENSEQRFTQVLELMEYIVKREYKDNQDFSQNDRVIYLRFANVTYHLTTIWKDNRYQSKIHLYFDNIHAILHSLVDIGVRGNDPMLIQNANEALNQLILNVPDVGIDQKLFQLFTDIVSTLRSSSSYFSSEEVRYTIQASLCSNISTITLKSKNHMDQTFSTVAEDARRVLFDLLKRPHVLIYEEALMAIAALVLRIPMIFNLDIYQELHQYIIHGFNSNCPGVINAACILIGDIYRHLAPRYLPQVLENIPIYFQILNPLILEHYEIRDIHPFILKAIAEMVLSINPEKCQLDFLDQMKIPLYNLLQSVYAMANLLDVNVKSDVDYGNSFYEYLCDAYKGYGKVYYPKDNITEERALLLQIDKLAQCIYKLHPKLGDNLLYSFGNMVASYGDQCSRKNNVIINRHSIHKLLIDVGKTRDQRLRTTLKKISDNLKSK
ncbi:hypothetical protein TRFO_17349 [Tritrichomonas foetus]|uniref:Importin N-terminal domain-containing protein n=1 Tax=Tritrichomonas foetus TaxID=1144522 RepID=A0A1J4KSU1_9EUKA|nr:hypothetical protein TRFO_17349 [Tritrichomonas foetus]|eukprot:OHT12726.1 hypothetical protein TRFO_17349 [Tritrichomonas foetus]